MEPTLAEKVLAKRIREYDANQQSAQASLSYCMTMLGALTERVRQLENRLTALEQRKR
jgi:hypothetical protein